MEFIYVSISIRQFADIAQNTDQTSLLCFVGLRSRAYIVVDQNTGKRNVFASVDICMASTPVRRLALTKLKEKFGDLYNDQNGIYREI